MATDLYTGVLITTVAPASSATSSTALQIARDYLAGYTGQYLFFRYDEDSYVLLKSDEIREDVSQNGSRYYILSDIQGTQIDTNHSSDIPYNSAYTAYPFQMETLTVLNTNSYLMYGSSESLPHLVEGASYYGYAQTFILLCFGAAYLIQRIFKHVSP